MKKIYMLWAGSDEAFDIYVNALEQEAAGTVLQRKEEAEPETSRLLTVQDGVGIVQVHGVLTNRDSWANQYFGLVSYNEIRTALYEAVLDPNVLEILMDVGSPGGIVSGLTDAVAAVDAAAKMKRLTVFSDSMIGSAAVWLATPARGRFISSVTMAGSIGALIKHREISKMLKSEGITDTFIRSGPNKQAANSSEPLTEAAKADLQEKVDYGNSLFLQAVADGYGITLAQATKMADGGKEYMGQQAVDAGLVDAVASFDEVFAAIQRRIAKTKEGGTEMKKKYKMTAEMVAAVAAGHVLTAEELAAAAVPVAESAPAAEGEGAPAPVAEGTAEGEGAPAPVAEGTPADEGTPAAAPEISALSVLKEQLTEKDAALLKANVEIAQLQAKIDATTASEGALKAIAAQAVSNMLVALGGTADTTLAALDASAIVARHADVQARFATEFKVGGVAAVGTEGAEAVAKVEEVPVSRRDAARQNVVKLNTAGGK